MIWKKVFSVILHTPPEVKTGIKSRSNPSKNFRDLTWTYQCSRLLSKAEKLEVGYGFQLLSPDIYKSRTAQNYS